MATTVIVFTRHEDHINNILTYEASERAKLRGALLGKTARFEAVVSSPLPRARDTANCMMKGAGVSLPLKTDDRLGDFKSDPRAVGMLEALKAKAKSEYSDDSDANLARAMLAMPELHPLMLARAQEGAQALTEIALANPSRFVLATSHGVARMEIALRHLRGLRGPEALDIATELIDRGESVMVMFEVADGKATFTGTKPLKLPLD